MIIKKLVLNTKNISTLDCDKKFMNQGTTNEKFPIEFNGKTYECRPIEKSGRMLYQINFNSSYLYLTVQRTRVVKISGHQFLLTAN